MRGHEKQKTKYPNIYRRNEDHYEIRISLGRDPITGKYGKKSEQFYGKLKDARSRQSEMLLEARGTNTAVTSWTMDQLASAYFDHVKAKRSPTTMTSDQGRWKILASGIGPRKVRTISSRQLDHLFDELIVQRKMKPQTVNRYRSLLSAMFKKAIAWGAIGTNPVAGTTSLTPDHLERDAVDEDEVKKLLTYWATKHPEYARFLWLALLLGARRGEICALQISDFDVNTNQITIQRAVKEAGVGGGLFVGPTKTHGKRKFTLDDAAVDVLTEQIAYVRSQNVFTSGSAYLFTTDGGITPWLPNRISQAFTRLRASMCPQCNYVRPYAQRNKQCPVDECGAELGLHFSIHGLRRLNTTMRLRAGVNPTYVQYTGGWRDASTMLEHYADHMEADAASSHAALRTLRPVQPLPDSFLSDDTQSRLSEGS